MSSKDFLDKKLNPGRVLTIIGIVLLVAIVVFFALGIFLDNEAFYYGALFSFFFGAIFFFVGLSKSQTFKYCYKNLEKQNLQDKAVDEYDNADVVGKDYFRMSDHFLYCKSEGVVLPYADIAWAYNSQTSINGIECYICTMVATKDHPVMRAGKTSSGNDKDDDLGYLMQKIRENSPNVLLGYDTQNIGAWRKLYRESKKNK